MILMFWVGAAITLVGVFFFWPLLLIGIAMMFISVAGDLCGGIKAIVANSNTARCPYCGGDMPRGVQRCARCQTLSYKDLLSQQKKVFEQGAVCPKCKTQKENERQDICMNCGYRFKT